MKLSSLLRFLFGEEAPRVRPQPFLEPQPLEPPFDDPVILLVQATLNELGCQGTSLWRSGATTYSDVHLDGQDLRIACNGSMVFLTVKIWPALSTYRAGICWAPEETYMRAKMTEGPGVIASTGDQAFDKTFLVGGEDAASLASAVPDAARRLLVDHSDMVIMIDPGFMDIRHWKWVTEPSLKAEPILRSPGSPVGFVKIGEQRFTASYIAQCTARVAALANALLSLEPQPLRPAV